MKHAVLSAAIILVAGSAYAAPAPVEDIAGGSTDDRIARLERVVKAKQQSEFQMQQRLEALQQEVLDLRGLSEQQSYQIEQMLQRQRQLYEDIANLSTKASAQPTIVQPAAVSSSAPSSLGETASYEQAVNLVLKDKKYEEAIPAFANFIQNYPNSTYAPNANYWLGQLLYNKSEFAGATKAFTTVVEKYKDSSKRGESLVKLGMIAEKTGDKAKAKAYYQKVSQEYPNSAAARIALQQLSSL
ncbi:MULTISPECIES: tol-pal system protein YbgF [Shewanella]|uniref:Cell division coordinator CpoB n=1 Tax=Shewanella fidelis TaxID=173509 RepID=A0AAW8NLX6_9GAMM|nr:MULTISPECIES: tol-pal system protein YbgF [Shewanella]MDR8524228.1 tol-pal system protein YbgF [Shewanella fidelis]MDW4813563.1 tol-pal system protein YbgF [Shewanella fidelis]MDW4817514.1 tol-pal system protein YbgF [Shewanella fidelis]MDW4821581.1 tol-pal system protein YbgF [Shewanella fidelis]MDW4825746.1 tol-pal system protein YbgF [Shewanella fidelis]